ncbi:MAG: organoarsenical effux MFS transporter ArsJ, partial [Alphaproteobacteria bacterium]|nr:organoarsenical effux MFS transporter ArsJ [Alphaproteobacteria bacterium]
LRSTLIGGLAVQVFALLMLSMLEPSWTHSISLAYVMVAQALSGVAKDLTKMSSKSAVKLTANPEDNSLERRLFKWVSFLTGSKNALKGFGFFVGGLGLAFLGFDFTLWSMAAILTAILLFSLFAVSSNLGKMPNKVKFKEVFSKDRRINILAFARVFLFAARDVWFVVAIPVYLSQQMGWAYDQVGAFMASWIILYGVVQAAMPALFGKTDTAQKAVSRVQVFGGFLAVIPAVIGASYLSGAKGFLDSSAWLADSGQILTIGLFVFGFFFAILSTLHSYLIVSFSDRDKVSLNVGFYYMANAIGRLGGTILSGICFQAGGLTASLFGSSMLLFVAFFASIYLKTIVCSPDLSASANR